MAINLEKGQRINLEKSNGTKLQNICVGVNWGAIEKKGFFGTKKEAVDLDASCAVYDDVSPYRRCFHIPVTVASRPITTSCKSSTTVVVLLAVQCRRPASGD